MGGRLHENWRVLAAALFSAVLVVGAYLLARNVESPSLAQASSETALLQAIATKDSDGDGLPDWEEALYGTDPHITDTFHLGMTDGEAVAKGLIVPKAIADISIAPPAPATKSDINYAAAGLTPPVENTLTDSFAKKFFTLYVAAKQANGGIELSSAETDTIMNQTLQSLSSSIIAAPDFRAPSALTVSGSGADALKTFAADAEAVLKKNKSDATTSELIYLQYAVENNNDATALAHIASMAKVYRDSAVGLAALSVPQELATANLALVNAMMRMSEITADLARVNTDSLTAMLALEQYMRAAQALGKAFIAIDNVYAAADITLAPSTPGASFLKTVAAIAAKQKTTITTL